ncbi:ABC transporter permease [Bacillus sp. FDAARGOS_1420]|uniref:ABC transporter permease n=1 Tax=Bacillus sp. FDAARGOS_1420 TaxID=2856338 RepID=UPI001C5BB2B9|nr:ABC transporter permease [Bacillus sp. FDAARGOS_1420]MBW3496732.1 ABC transporter permease [Bacillus sp. FDAARGOS_1420]
MNTNENIRMAISSIFAHKMRSILTMLGIIIGISAIITIIAMGDGVNKKLKADLSKNKNDDITIYYDNRDGDENNAKITPDMKKRLESLQGVKSVYPNASTDTKVYAGAKDISLNVNGGTGKFMEDNKLKMIHGREFHVQELEQATSVVILNETAFQKLFPKWTNDLYIDIKGKPYKVVGVYKSTFESDYNMAFAEGYTSLDNIAVLSGVDEYQSVTLKLHLSSNQKEIEQQAVSILNEMKSPNFKYAFKTDHHKEDDEAMKDIDDSLGTLKLVFGGIAGISLVVGGIGVMNIMLVSVTERTREIGIRKALGATRGKILMQFLIESCILTGLGGLIGFVLGVLFSWIVAFFGEWPLVISIGLGLTAVGVSMFIGILFGFLPANKAARLEPIECLRYE